MVPASAGCGVMLAIHGVWSEGRLHVWAEDNSRLGLSSQPRAGGPSRLVRPHPFAASSGLLTDALADFGEQVADLGRKATETELVLWLPATAGRPLTSPDVAAADAAVASAAGASAAVARAAGGRGAGGPGARPRLARAAPPGTRRTPAAEGGGPPASWGGPPARPPAA